MGPLAAGSVVLVPFPFTDLARTKLRPAVVLAGVGRGDWILCQVTSNPYADASAVTLEPSDFETGGLQLVSYARPGRLFTAHSSLFVGQPGALQPQALGEIIDAVVYLLQSPSKPCQLQ